MDERERILSDLKRWVRQQRRDGVEQVLIDRSLRFDSAKAVAPKDDPEAVASRPREGLPQDLFGTLAPEQAGRQAVKLDAATVAELSARHPQWAGTQLLPLAAEIEACRACGLGTLRHRSVPGMGNPQAKLVFVGEAPGAEEDNQGLPFVGRAGQLLDKILAAIDLKREDVHILNIIKCRPPENRNPAPDEIEACRHFLEQQIEIIRPGMIVALGLFAAQWLTGKRMSLTQLRETGPYAYRGIPVYTTYHTAALLRNPHWKKPAWEDFKIIRREYDKL